MQLSEYEQANMLLLDPAFIEAQAELSTSEVEKEDTTEGIETTAENDIQNTIFSHAETFGLRAAAELREQLSGPQNKSKRRAIKKILAQDPDAANQWEDPTELDELDDFPIIANSTVSVDPENKFLHNERGQRVQKFIDGLSGVNRRIAVANFLQDRTYQEIAQEHELTEEAVKSRCKRLRMKFRESIPWDQMDFA